MRDHLTDEEHADVELEKAVAEGEYIAEHWTEMDPVELARRRFNLATYWESRRTA